MPSLRLLRVPNKPRLLPTLRRSVSLVNARDHLPLIRVLRVGIFVLFMASSLRKVTLKSSSCSSVTSPLRPESKLSAFLMTSAFRAAILALRCILLASGDVSVWTVFNAEAANAARRLLSFSLRGEEVFLFCCSWLSCCCCCCCCCPFLSSHAMELSSVLVSLQLPDEDKDDGSNADTPGSFHVLISSEFFSLTSFASFSFFSFSVTTAFFSISIFLELAVTEL